MSIKPALALAAPRAGEQHAARRTMRWWSSLAHPAATHLMRSQFSAATASRPPSSSPSLRGASSLREQRLASAASSAAGASAARPARRPALAPACVRRDRTARSAHATAPAQQRRSAPRRLHALQRRGRKPAHAGPASRGRLERCLERAAPRRPARSPARLSSAARSHLIVSASDRGARSPAPDSRRAAPDRARPPRGSGGSTSCSMVVESSSISSCAGAARAAPAARSGASAQQLREPGVEGADLHRPPALSTRACSCAQRGSQARASAGGTPRARSASARVLVGAGVARTRASHSSRRCAHFAGGLAGEGDRQDLVRRGAVEQGAQDARHQHPGLAGAGAGLDDDAAPRIAGQRRRSAPRRRRARRRGRPAQAAPDAPAFTSLQWSRRHRPRASQNSQTVPSPSAGKAAPARMRAGSAAIPASPARALCCDVVRARSRPTLVGLVEREVAGRTEPRLRCRMQRGIERELGVLERLAAPCPSSACASVGLVVDQLQRRAARGAVDAVDAAVQRAAPASPAATARSPTSAALERAALRLAARAASACSAAQAPAKQARERQQSASSSASLAPMRRALGPAATQCAHVVVAAARRRSRAM